MPAYAALVRRLVALPVVLIAFTVAGAGCKSDGRVLRPANPDQNLSISTTVVSESDTGGLDVGSSTTVPGFQVTGGESVVLTAPWRSGAEIDARYTCDGDNVSPGLSWSAAPAGTVEIAISLVDNDYPDFGHWVITGIPASFVGIAEGVVPEGATVAVNGNGTAGYTGPCPPLETTHTYVFTVYYLNTATTDTATTAIADLLPLLDQGAVAIASVDGQFSRL